MIKLLIFTLFLIPVRFFYYWFMYVYVFLYLIYIIFLPIRKRFSNLSYFLGIDLLSYWIILLTVWISFLMILGRNSIFKNNYYPKIFNLVLVVMVFSLFILFISINILIFYIFFEVRLVPIILIILGWGYQPERLEAGYYLFFYTIFASLPIIVAIFYVIRLSYRLDFLFLHSLDLPIFYILMLLVFLIKIPMYIVHLWLPKAHVEASVAGSIILAGIILKIGGYGLIRLIFIFKDFLYLNMYLIIFSLFSSFWVTLICLRQIDIKSLIAYSSVSHIRIVLVGVLTITSWGFVGALVVIVAHGLCSSGLFCLANINYERLGRRRILINKGLINIIPSLRFWWFLFIACNISAPPSLNLFGEIFLIVRIMSWNWIIFIPLIFILFFGGAYSLYLYSYRQHGRFYVGLNVLRSPKLSEFLLLLVHLVPLNILILKRRIFLIYLNSLLKYWFVVPEK